MFGGRNEVFSGESVFFADFTFLLDKYDPAGL